MTMRIIRQIQMLPLFLVIIPVHRTLRGNLERRK